MEKKITLLLCLILAARFTVFAQCSSWIEKSSVRSLDGDVVTTDANNNVYSSGGFVFSIHFGSDSLIDTAGFGYYINKFNSSGVLQWAIQFQTQSAITPVIIQNRGSLYVTGLFVDSMVTNVKTGSKLVMPGRNMFLMKLDLNGNILWSKIFKGSITGIVNPASIVFNQLNQVYITGCFSDTVAFGSKTFITPDNNFEKFGQETFVVKTDSNGNVIWAIHSTSTAQFCNSNGYCLSVDNDGNLLLVGSCDSIITFGSKTLNVLNTNISGYLNGNPFVAKFDSAGNCLWMIGGLGNLKVNTSLLDVVTDKQNNIYFAGALDDTMTISGQPLYPANGDFYYCKYSPQGNPIWVKQIPGYTNIYGSPSSLIIDSSNYLWMAGVDNANISFGSFNTITFPQSLFIAGFDTSGTFINAIGSKGILWGTSLALGGDGSLYIGCATAVDTISFDGNTDIGPEIDSIGVDIILKYCTATAGINQLPATTNQLSIYPNPTNGEITISSAKNIDEITVTNLLGQTLLISSFKNQGVKQIIDLNKFAGGMYFVTIKSGGLSTTQKIIITK